MTKHDKKITAGKQRKRTPKKRRLSIRLRLPGGRNGSAKKQATEAEETTVHQPTKSNETPAQRTRSFSQRPEGAYLIDGLIPYGTSENPGTKVNLNLVKSFSHLNNKLRESKKMVLVPADVRRITADGDSAILLSQLLYWFDNGADGSPRATISKNGFRYVSNSHRQWAIDTGLPERRVRTVIEKLVESGLVVKEIKKYDASPTTHLRPVLEEIVRRLSQLRKHEIKAGTSRLPKVKNSLELLLPSD